MRQIVLSGLGDHVARKVNTRGMNAEDRKRLRYAYKVRWRKGNSREGEREGGVRRMECSERRSGSDKKCNISIWSPALDCLDSAV